MRILLTTSLLFFSLASVAGSHGQFLLSCVSKSLRTHVYMELNDYDYMDEALFPRRIIVSVMGHMAVFDEKQEYGFSFKTIDENGILEIHSTDDEKSYAFRVDFREKTSAQVTIEKAVNPRTEEAFSGLALTCTKSHDL